MILPAISLTLYALLDALGDANQFRRWLEGLGAWFTLDRWRIKYRDPSGPYTWQNWRWWMWLGGGSFIDFWHTVKTAKFVAVAVPLLVLAGAPLWLLLPLWLGYGVVFNLTYHGVT